MICPLKKSEYIESQDRHVESYWTNTDCEETCACWDDELNLPCFKALLYYVKKLSQLKISGGINTHSY